MKSDEVDIEDKQIFLRNQILQGGLDAESFMDYMGTVKKEGENINVQNWTMQELKQVVTDFKAQIKADADALKKVQLSQFRQSKQVVNKILSSIIAKKEKIFYDKGMWDYQITNQLTCKELKKAFIFNQKIKPRVEILKWQVKSQGGFLGFGSTKQLWVSIRTNFTDKQIERTNSDFEWFRSAMIRLNPGPYVPPLGQLRNIQPEDKKGLNRRVKLMERFLNSLLNYEYLIQNPLAKAFFSEYDHNKFSNLKNRQKSSNVPKNVGHIQNLQGKFEIQISDRTQKAIKNCSSFGKVAHQIYTDVEVQINKVLSDMQTLSKHVLYISNSCGLLHQKYTKICALNQVSGSSMETMMIYLNNLFSNIGKNIKDQMGVIKNFSDQFVQYSIRSWEEFLIHDRRYQRQLDNYLNLKSELIKKKQRSFNEIGKWELQSEAEYQRITKMDLASMSKDDIFQLMFPRQNKLQQQLRLWMGYLNTTYQKSFKVLLKQQQQQIKQKFNVFIEHSQKVSEQHNNAFLQFKQILANSS